MKKLFPLLTCLFILPKYSPGFNVYVATINATCSNANGTMWANVDGGVSPHSILWSNGATSWEVNGLTGGTTLTATVTDAMGATASNTATVQSQPYLNFIGFSFAGTGPCEGFCNGQGYTPILDLDGLPPYTGTYDGVSMPEIQYGNQTWLVADNVCWNAPGNVYIVDANGCSINTYWPPDFISPTPQLTGVTTTDACTTTEGTAVMQFVGDEGYTTFEYLDMNGNVVVSPTGNIPVTLLPGDYVASAASITGHTDDWITWYLLSCTTVTQPFTIHGCDVPSGLNTVNTTSTSAKLNWNTNDCAVGYRIRYKQAGTSEWTTKNVSSNIGSKNITGLLPNTPYVWKVRSKCSANPVVYSPWSSNNLFYTEQKLSGSEENETVALHIFPNPAGDHLTISTTNFEIEKIEITNLFGQIILTQEPETQNSKPETQIDVSTLPSGIYLLTASANGVRATKMFVKQ